MVQTTNRKLPRSLLVLVTTWCSLLIAGCTGIEAVKPPGPTPGCHGLECNVDVFVNNCVVSVDPPTLTVPTEFKVIKWWIKRGSYHFQNNGITIKNPGSGITPKPVSPGHPVMFEMHDDHTVQGPIPYTVTVVPDSGGAACVLDPVIFNQ